MHEGIPLICNMKLPKNLLINDSLCQLNTGSNERTFFAVYTLRADPLDVKPEIAEWAGELLAGYGKTEEDARKQLEEICTRLDLVNHRWYER